MARNLAEELFGPGGELEKAPVKKATTMPKKKVAKVTGDVGLLDEEQQEAERAAKREKRKKKLSKAIEKW